MRRINKSRREAAPKQSTRDLRALLADIVQSSDDAIFSRGLDGTISSWNHAAERIFGYRAEEIVGKLSSLLLPPDRLDETNRLLGKISRGSRIEHFETVRMHKDRRCLIVSLTLSPIRDSQGIVIGASTIARDITPQRELERRLTESGEREQQRLGRDLHDGLGQQLAGMELACRALARSLSRRSPHDAGAAKLLVEQIQAATGQTRALARGLTPVLETPNGLMLALEDFARTHRNLLKVNCSFICEEPVLIPDHCAALHLFRIVQEAVANAIRHGRARRVQVTLRRKKGKLSLEIHDNGCGLPAHAARGTGMGLRIMKYRATALGGSVQTVNTAPRGVLLTCIVPVSRLNAQSPAPQ